MALPLTKEKLLTMYRRMYLNRKYEERIYYLFLEGAIPGTVHQSTGQEACCVGACADLTDDDYVIGTHRPAGHAIAKGVAINDMMAEMFAKKTGCNGGYGGAMHVSDIRRGVIPAVAIVGGGIPISVGIGLSCKMRKTNNVCVCFFGDGATNEGAFHESLNAAAIWNLPVVFVIENNLYGASTPIKLTCKLENLADRANSYVMASEIADGQDILAVYDAASRAVERARTGGGPTLLELKTYRRCGHSRNDACGYRSKEEEREWFERDPIVIARSRILELGMATGEELDKINAEVEAEIEAAVEYAKAQPSPVPEDALKYVYA
jgi:Pyruvate/2-oxoglutarate dehydrogenase complex, dehydrogenase (E1) component, eukaryotic type, alpha subunit